MTQANPLVPDFTKPKKTPKYAGIQPTGTNILIKAITQDEVSKGGIIIPEELRKKEDMVERMGHVVAIGPCAYVGWKGCDIEGKTPAECWGIKVGDLVEHLKYEGINSTAEGFEEYRYITDVQIVGVVQPLEDEK